VTLLVGGILFILCLWYLRKPTYTNLPPAVPGGLPLVGHLFSVENLNEFGKEMMQYSTILGDVICLHMISRVVVIVHTPELIKEMFVKKADHFSNRPDWIGLVKLVTNNKGRFFLISCNRYLTEIII
jgi:hypothetical protein